MATLSSIHELPAALARQPSLSALPIEVSGEEQLHLPLFHFLSCLVSLVQFGVLCAFAYYEVYLPQLEAPWYYVVAFPALVVFYNGYASLTTISEEYVTSQPMRMALSRADGWLIGLMLVALLGPDAAFLFCRTQLTKVGATLSKTAELQFVLWGAGLHLFVDAPILTLVVLMHKRLALPWGPIAKLMAITTLASLTYNLIWHVIRMATIRVDEDESPGLGLSRASSTLGYTSPTKRRTLRKTDTVKYVGLENTAIVGNVQTAYEA